MKPDTTRTTIERHPADRPVHIGDIWGKLRVIAAEPDWTPRGLLEDSIALLIDAGTPNLCVYDYTNAQWLYVGLSTSRTA